MGRDLLRRMLFKIRFGRIPVELMRGTSDMPLYQDGTKPDTEIPL
jgi:hypothetical protein